MANRIVVINQLRAKIISQGLVNLESMARRMSKNTTYNTEEMYSILRLFVQEANAALQAGETVKIDGLFSLTPSMKVGGSVSMGVRPDRGAMAGLNNPLLWTTDKVVNQAHQHKSAAELVALWNADHPDDPVKD